ncbi:MAG: non-heme iron oxygenase ferredoxin subunit [Chloroflexota bacterium]|jgi:3-phenylpropionate/trans-cinnamate dioxygenase ferredoxin subunit|nr:non-heme iron oxygenase ferredoxin subunit [Chloroflexota bacterium]
MAKITYYPVCPTNELPPGERLFIELGDQPVVILNLAGEYYAIGDVCTHDQGPLGEGEVEDHEIICPRHGARFDIRTGEVRALPAIQDIPTYPVRVNDNIVEIGLEE